MKYGLILSAALCAVPFALPAFATSAAQVETTAPELISFDGIKRLSVEASRVGMLSQELSFTLTVGTDGKPTACKINREFRRKYIEIALCRPLLEHHTFKPARNMDGDAVEGEFTGLLDFRMFFNSDGSSNLRDL